MLTALEGTVSRDFRGRLIISTDIAKYQSISAVLYVNFSNTVDFLIQSALSGGLFDRLPVLSNRKVTAGDFMFTHLFTVRQ